MLSCRVILDVPTELARYLAIRLRERRREIGAGRGTRRECRYVSVCTDARRPAGEGIPDSAGAYRHVRAGTEQARLAQGDSSDHPSLGLSPA